MLPAVLAACASAPPPPPGPVAIVAAARPACGAVRVDDRSVPPSPDRATVVRDAMREELAALGACASQYRIQVNLTIEAASAARARIRLHVVVYAKDGALAAEIPTTVSGDRSSPQDLVATDALLRAAAQQAAHVFSQNFH
jgi:hypothetical protein